MFAMFICMYLQLLRLMQNIILTVNISTYDFSFGMIDNHTLWLYLMASNIYMYTHKQPKSNSYTVTSVLYEPGKVGRLL